MNIHIEKKTWSICTSGIINWFLFFYFNLIYVIWHNIYIYHNIIYNWCIKDFCWNMLNNSAQIISEQLNKLSQNPQICVLTIQIRKQSITNIIEGALFLPKSQIQTLHKVTSFLNSNTVNYFNFFWVLYKWNNRICINTCFFVCGLLFSILLMWDFYV